MDAYLLLRIIVTCILAVTVAIGVSRFSIASSLIKIFIYYLAYALFVEVATSSFLHLDETLRKILFTTFGLIESIFLFYFIGHCVKKEFIKTICKILIYLSIPVWIIMFLLIRNFDQQVSYFDSTCGILISILSAYTLLEFAESDQPFATQPIFWFILATFLYCFCSLILTMLFTSEIAKELWYLNNGANLLTYILIIVGFIKIKPAQRIETIH
jgi:hypothetical protein